MLTPELGDTYSPIADPTTEGLEGGFISASLPVFLLFGDRRYNDERGELLGFEQELEHLVPP